MHTCITRPPCVNSLYATNSGNMQAVFWDRHQIICRCYVENISYIYQPTSSAVVNSYITHICVSKLTIIGSANGLSPGWCQAIIWSNDGILLIGPLGTNFNEILIVIDTFSFKKIHLKMAAILCWPECVNGIISPRKWPLYPEHKVSWHGLVNITLSTNLSNLTLTVLCNFSLHFLLCQQWYKKAITSTDCLPRKKLKVVALT